MARLPQTRSRSLSLSLSLALSLYGLYVSVHISGCTIRFAGAEDCVIQKDGEELAQDTLLSESDFANQV